jgi:hypothetical protein
MIKAAAIPVSEERDLVSHVVTLQDTGSLKAKIDLPLVWWTGR